MSLPYQLSVYLLSLSVSQPSVLICFVLLCLHSLQTKMTEEVKTEHNVTKTFRYSYPTCTNEEVLFKLEVPVEIPHAGSTRELVQRVINMFHIPVYLEDDLNEKLAKFVAEETKSFHNERDEKLLNQLKNTELNSEGIVKNWEKLFKDNVMDFAEQKGTSDEEVFAAAYHKLVHSPALESILQMENSYAKTFSEVLNNRDEDIKQLTQKQTDEMEEKVSQLNISTTEEDINSLAAAHFEAQALAAGRWGSTLDALGAAQRAQHRAALMQALDALQAARHVHTPSSSPLAAVGPSLGAGAPPTEAPSRLEESFTIHLGSQLKQTHNIRIVAADLIELCALENPDSDTEQSRRLQASLSLYTSELSGVVLVTDSGPGRPAPPTSRLARAAAARTDHHFTHVDLQLRDIAEKVHGPAEARNLSRLRSQTEGSAPGGGGGGARARRGLQAGDVFVTRHSNLPDAHVVFHLIVDHSTLRSGDITSRHPAILGLRNILKAACANDITSLALPLLLRHELTEEMTVSWCVRRAELVLKCVKGFMMEMAGWGGAELRTLTAALPPAVAPPLFHALRQLLPAVFRISNPVNMRQPRD